MNSPEQQRPAPDQDALDRLRDRTDELELIISSLTIFALVSLPGWLLNSFTRVYTHLSTSQLIALTMGSSIVSGICYTLAVCFVIHLMARAYWVGLIGLRTVFPEGINWERTPGIGPMAREHYREKLPNVDTVIDRADRLASSLFAVISMLTLGVLWFGTIFIVTLVITGVIGSRFGLTNAGIGIGALVLFVLFVGIPVLHYLLDAQLAARYPRLRSNRAFTMLVSVLRTISGLTYPQRLILPVKLTLQSNTRPRLYSMAMGLSMFAIVIIGNTKVASWQTFTLSGVFDYLDAEELGGGFYGTYYEDMAVPRDGLRAWPRLTSFEQSGSFARLFIPYQPLRDNIVLDKNCDRENEDTDPVDCLRELWSVAVEGETLPMSSFIPAERGDMGMRGLVGLVPLTGLKPGLRRITVVWNPGASDDEVLLDDRLQGNTRTFEIPFAFAPAVEMPLP